MCEGLARGSHLAQEQRRLDSPAPRERRAVQQLAVPAHGGRRPQLARPLVAGAREDERHAEGESRRAGLDTVIALGQCRARGAGILEHRSHMPGGERRVGGFGPQARGLLRIAGRTPGCGGEDVAGGHRVPAREGHVPAQKLDSDRDRVVGDERRGLVQQLHGVLAAAGDPGIRGGLEQSPPP